MSRVVLMCGPAGSGKTVYARALERAGFRRLSLDEEAWALGHREHPLPEPVERRIDALLQRRLLDLIATGADVVVDRAFPSRRERLAYRRLLAGTGADIETVYLATPREVVLERVAARRGVGPGDLVLDEAWAAHYVDSFEPPTEDEGALTVIRSAPGTDPDVDPPPAVDGAPAPGDTGDQPSRMERS